MSRRVKIIIIAVVVVLIIAYGVIQTGKKVVMSSTATCVKGDAKHPWSGGSGEPPDGWGAYKRAKKQYLGLNDENSPEYDHVEGFFKAIDMQYSAKGIRTYANEIKAWLSSGRADYHWVVQKGELLC